jgi:DNA-binding NarL/FixJ family response regulator
MFAALRAELPPQVVLMDIEIPNHISVIEGMDVLKDRSAETRVVMLTSHSDDREIFASLCAGASGYLLKDDTADRILEAIKEANAGGVVMNPQIAQRVITMFTYYAVPNKAYNLTDREREVLELLVDGLKKYEIADSLSLAYSTIASHMRNIYSKLHVHSRTDAVVKALKERLF